MYAETSRNIDIMFIFKCITDRTHRETQINVLWIFKYLMLGFTQSKNCRRIKGHRNRRCCWRQGLCDNVGGCRRCQPVIQTTTKISTIISSSHHHGSQRHVKKYAAKEKGGNSHRQQNR